MSADISEVLPDPARTASPAAPAAAVAYDAFISYSHAKDKPIAAALQSVAQRLGKSWKQRRALRLFRDDTSLSATPHLWPSIEQALGQSRFLILLASPEAASSPWVDKELAWWVDRNGANTVLIALTAGELAWDAAAGDFRWSEAPPLPPALKGRFAAEPLWIDLRNYRDGVRSRDPEFADRAAGFAAALHGRPKEDLLSQELRQQRRALRLAWSAVGALVVLVGLAGWQWRVAETQRNRAQRSLDVATNTVDSLLRDIVDKYRVGGVPGIAGVQPEVIKDILERALQLQRQLAQGGETSSNLLNSQAAAQLETAEVQLVLGDMKGALAAAIQARDIVRSMLALTPGSTGDQEKLAITDEVMGEVLSAQGDVAGALASYQEALAIRKTLAQKSPANTQQQLDLAATGEKVGNLLKAQGDLAGALAAYRDNLAIRKTLAEKDPNNSELQRDLSIIDYKVGSVLEKQGDLAGALAAYRTSLAIDKALEQKEHRNTQWALDLAATDDAIADVLMDQDDFAGALAAAQESVALRKEAVTVDPSNADWQRDLAICIDRMADLLRKQGDLAGSLASHRDALAIETAVTLKNPDDSQSQLYLIHSYIVIGDILKAQGDLAGARASYREGLTAVRPLAHKYSDSPGWQMGIVTCLWRLADAGDNPAANYSEALTILRPLDAAGKLTPVQKSWIPRLETALAKAKQSH